MEKITNSKNFMIVICIISLLVVIGFTAYFVFNRKPTTYKEITYTEMQELIKGEDPFILFIGKDSCSHCTQFKVTVNDVVKKYGITVNYIDLGLLTDEENAYINSHFVISGTPTTLLFKSGNGDIESRVVSKIKGAKNYSEFVNELKKYEFIKD